MPIDPDDVFFLSATEFWFQSGLVTHNTSHIRLGTGVTPIPTYFGTTITVDPYFPEAAYPIWGLDGLGWTRYSTPVIDRTSLDTRVYGSGTSSSGGEVRLDAGRLQMWADDGTPTFDSEDSRQYLTDVYTGSITIPEVNGGSGGAGGGGNGQRRGAQRLRKVEADSAGKADRARREAAGRPAVALTDGCVDTKLCVLLAWPLHQDCSIPDMHRVTCLQSR